MQEPERRKVGYTRHTAAFAIVLCSGLVRAETWQCQAGTSWSEHGNVLVTLTTNEDEVSGMIWVAGRAHETSYVVEGPNSRWNFGRNSELAFIVHPDGAGFLYDFSAVGLGVNVSASQRYACRRADEPSGQPSDESPQMP